MSWLSLRTRDTKHSKGLFIGLVNACKLRSRLRFLTCFCSLMHNAQHIQAEMCWFPSSVLSWSYSTTQRCYEPGFVQCSFLKISYVIWVWVLGLQFVLHKRSSQRHSRRQTPLSPLEEYNWDNTLLMLAVGLAKTRMSAVGHAQAFALALGEKTTRRNCCTKWI